MRRWIGPACWAVVNWTFRNKIQWNFSLKMIYFFFIQGNRFKMTSAKWLLFYLREDELRRLPPDLVKSRSREFGFYRIALKFDRHLGSTAAEVPVKFLSDWKSLNPNLAASRLREILRSDVLLLSEWIEVWGQDAYFNFLDDWFKLRLLFYKLRCLYFAGAETITTVNLLINWLYN